MNKYERTILDGIDMKISIDSNEYAIPPESLFSLAARKNKKRSFLFVSKVLGKHMPVDPNVSLAAGRLLAAIYSRNALSVNAGFENDAADILKSHGIAAAKVSPAGKTLSAKYPLEKVRLEEPTLFIGFAETATALGMSAFESFSGNAWYMQTTRKELDMECIKFMEEHSHASLHMMYPKNKVPLGKIKNVVFIDDELTTGNTIMNIIKSMKEIIPAKKFSVLTILDWRGSEHKEKFENFETEHGLKVDVMSVLKGEIEVDDSKWKIRLEQESAEELDGIFEDCGCEHSDDSKCSQADEKEPYANAARRIEQISLSHFFKKEDIQSGALISHSGRFGLSSSDSSYIDSAVNRSARFLERRVHGDKVLFLGSGEFMFLPMKIGSFVSENTGRGILYHSTTRSPIYPDASHGYAVKNKVEFNDPQSPGVKNFAYNMPKCGYDQIFIFVEEKPDENGMAELKKVIDAAGAGEAFVVYFADPLENRDIPDIGSYDKDEVEFLLKDISELMSEKGNEYREMAIQSGAHYSEMLPVEYRPSSEYMKLFEESLVQNSIRIARSVERACHAIIKQKGKDVVLVSLARAGTPAGILMKRYMRKAYGIDPAHYSISIIRGKGFDENAIKFISQRHDTANVQFIDGWTGKGAIKRELERSCDDMVEKYGIDLPSDLAVIADPGGFCEIAGTREDFLIPSACLNSTVSGLLSRTVQRDDIIGPGDFHGVKFYKELKEHDVSNRFVDSISSHFGEVGSADGECSRLNAEKCDMQGMCDVENIKEEFGIDDVNLIKPGIGETTRVLLRRVPWKILISTDMDDEDVAHIIQLADEKGVETNQYPLKKYKCCGLIKKVKGGDI